MPKFDQDVAINHVIYKGKPRLKISYKVVMEQYGQAIFISYQTYNLVAPGTDFIISFFFVQTVETSKGCFSDSSNNLA